MTAESQENHRRAKCILDSVPRQGNVKVTWIEDSLFLKWRVNERRSRNQTEEEDGVSFQKLFTQLRREIWSGGDLLRRGMKEPWVIANASNFLFLFSLFIPRIPFDQQIRCTRSKGWPKYFTATNTGYVLQKNNENMLTDRNCTITV